MPVFQEKPLPYDLSNFTILIVEDSPYMQALLSQMLKIFGVGEILACSSARDAIELLTITQAAKKSKYLQSVDIVLTDWLMPKGGGGDELIEWIRKHDKESVCFLPIIVVSGYTTEYVTNHARDLGANETLVKPISGTSLAGRICAVIDHPRPFIRSPRYFGPDRRRKEVPYKSEDRRKIIAKQITVQI